jgi:hypothetical protein
VQIAPSKATNKQVLPVDSQSNIAAPWDPLQASLEEKRRRQQQYANELSKYSIVCCRRL